MSQHLNQTKCTSTLMLRLGSAFHFVMWTTVGT